jgi:hypothetical protein
MTSNANADSPNPSISPQSIVETARVNLKVPKGFSSEHIYLGAEEPETSNGPGVVDKTFTLNNRIRSVRTELTLFNEGFLKVRQYQQEKLHRDYLLELRFLDPGPTVIRRTVKRMFWAAIALSGAAAVTWLIGRLTMLAPYMYPASIVCVTGAIVALLLFAYQSGEKVLFRTATANIPVLMLLGSFDCFRSYRSIVPEIGQAIGEAISGNTLKKEPFLRAEMQELYRLRNDGVITAKSCDKGTSRILSRFR